MAKGKNKTANADVTAAPTNLDERITLFFSVQPFGHVATLGDLMLDLSQKELADYVPKEQVDSILKRLANDKIELPKGKEAQAETARTREIMASLERLSKAGTLEKVKTGADNNAEEGYRFVGERDADDDTAEVTRVPIDRIKIDEKRYQLREGGTNQKIVDRYAANADQLPAVDVYQFGDDDKLTLVGGFHRVKAWAQAGFDMVPVRIHKGTKEDAMLFAVRQNASHGYTRTEGDVKTAVGAYLSMSAKHRTNASVASVAKAVKIAWATADRYVRHWRKLWAVPAKPATVIDDTGKEHDAGTPKPVTTEAAPAVQLPDGSGDAPAPAHTVFDKQGTPVGDPELARAFTDTRFTDAIGQVHTLLQYISDFRPDGYQVSTIPVKGREEMLNEIRWYLDKLRDSTPFAVTPSDAGQVSKELSMSVRRRWMDKAEYDIYNKATAPAIPGEQPPAAPPSDATPAKKTRKGRKGQAESGPTSPMDLGNPVPLSAERVEGDAEGTANLEYASGNVIVHHDGPAADQTETPAVPVDDQSNAA